MIEEKLNEAIKNKENWEQTFSQLQTQLKIAEKNVDYWNGQIDALKDILELETINKDE